MNMKRTAAWVVPAVLLCLCLGCAGTTRWTCPRAPAVPPNPHLLEGYALLYALASREKDVDRLLHDGVASTRGQEVIEEIAQVNRDLLRSLQQWAMEGAEHTLCDTGPLDLETYSRESIRSKVAWQLLLSGRGECTKTFLLAQHQALVHEAGLLRAIHGSDGCKERKAKSAEYAERLERLSARVAEMIQIEE